MIFLIATPKDSEDGQSAFKEPNEKDGPLKKPVFEIITTIQPVRRAPIEYASSSSPESSDQNHGDSGGASERGSCSGSSSDEGSIQSSSSSGEESDEGEEENIDPSFKKTEEMVIHSKHPINALRATVEYYDDNPLVEYAEKTATVQAPYDALASYC